MNIIIIPNEPNPNMMGRHYGIAKALAARGHQVHTVMWDLPHQMKPAALVRHIFTSLAVKDYDYENLKLHHFGRLPLFWPYINGWLFKYQLRKLYRRINADIIFAESFTNETSVPKNLPFIYDLADDYAAPAEVFGSIIHKLMFKILSVQSTMRQQCRDALAVTAVSEPLCAFARQYNSQVTKLPNGVEADIIANLKTLKTRPVNAHSLLYVSGFGPWSQPVKVMQATLELRKRFPDIQLTLVGEGSEVPAIQEFISQHQAQNFIDYKGPIHDRTKVFQLISDHAIGINISQKNKWRDAAHPMKVIEYSALGRKIVSTDLEGVIALGLPNIFMFSEKSKVHDLKRTIRQALEAPAQIYSDVSQQILAEYSWDVLIKQLITTTKTALRPDNRLTILHVTPSYPPTIGGLEKVVQVLAQTQALAHRRVSVLTSRAKSIAQSKPNDVPIDRFSYFVLANTIIMPGLIAKLLRASKKRHIIHLHITQAFTPEIVWLTSRIKRFHYIAHVHIDVPPSGKAGFLLNIYKPLILRRVLHGASYVIVFSEEQQLRICQKYGLPAAKVVVIPNGAEASFYSDKTRKLHTRPRLLFVGRLGFQKNLRQLFQALAGVSERFETTLVGDGEQEAELRLLAVKLKLKNIHFAGRAEGQKLRDYYARSDIFVLPSEREGMPLVLLEAMAMGLPTIATNVMGNRDIIKNNRNGLLVPYNDPLALQRALVRVSSSSELYARLHISARHLANEYRWPIIADRFLKLYGQAS